MNTFLSQHTQCDTRKRLSQYTLHGELPCHQTPYTKQQQLCDKAPNKKWLQLCHSIHVLCEVTGSPLCYNRINLRKVKIPNCRWERSNMEKYKKLGSSPQGQQAALCHSNDTWIHWSARKAVNHNSELCNKLNSMCISIGQYLRAIGGKMHKMTSLLTFSLLYCIKQVDCMFPSVCSVIDHRRRQNVVRTSVTY